MTELGDVIIDCQHQLVLVQVVGEPAPRQALVNLCTPDVLPETGTTGMLMIGILAIILLRMVVRHPN